jgi:hypothetical protein
MTGSFFRLSLQDKRRSTRMLSYRTLSKAIFSTSITSIAYAYAKRHSEITWNMIFAAGFLRMRVISIIDTLICWRRGRLWMLVDVPKFLVHYYRSIHYELHSAYCVSPSKAI